MTPNPEHRAPHPRRLVWLKRLLLAGLVVLLAVGGLRLLWGHLMQARLNRAVADVQARGEPIRFDDLQREPLPDPLNGAWYIDRALQAWPSVPGTAALRIDDTDWFNQGPDAGYTDPITDNPAYLAQCMAALDLLRRAAECNDADWHVVVTRPVFDINITHWAEARRLAWLLKDVADRAADAGRYDLFFEIALHQYTLARHLQSRPSFLVDALIAMSITDLITETIEDKLPHIDDAALRDPAVRDRIQQLIACLTDDATMREGMIRGLVMDRYATFDYFQCMIDGTPTNWWYTSGADLFTHDTPVFKQAMRPMLLHAQASVTEELTRQIEALRRGAPFAEQRDADAAFAQTIVDNPALYPYLHEFYDIGYAVPVATLYRNTARMRLAATALAIRLYQADHGHRPATLNDLVPRYLTALPADPFADDRRPLGYLPQGVTPILSDPTLYNDEQYAKVATRLRPYPLLYSIGADQQDQQGGTLVIKHEGDIETTRFTAPDEPGDIQFLLDALPKPLFTTEELFGDPFNFYEDDPFGVNADDRFDDDFGDTFE